MSIELDLLLPPMENKRAGVTVRREMEHVRPQIRDQACKLGWL